MRYAGEEKRKMEKVSQPHVRPGAAGILGEQSNTVRTADAY